MSKENANTSTFISYDNMGMAIAPHKGSDTTDLMVYGHEGWITTDKNRYEIGERVRAELHWGHDMRPDGFFRLHEFSAFVITPDGEKIMLSPEKAEGDFYYIDYVPEKNGFYTMMVLYHNRYARNENDEYFEGDRQKYPDILQVMDYLQPYGTSFAVGCGGGDGSFIPESRISFVPEEWPAEDAVVFKAHLLKDGEGIPQASVMIVHFDGQEYHERVMNTANDGSIFFSVHQKGQYCLFYRTGLDEAIEGYYDSMDIISTFTYVHR